MQEAPATQLVGVNAEGGEEQAGNSTEVNNQPSSVHCGEFPADQPVPGINNSNKTWISQAMETHTAKPKDNHYEQDSNIGKKIYQQ